jgi:hypothetical protein
VLQELFPLLSVGEIRLLPLFSLLAAIRQLYITILPRVSSRYVLGLYGSPGPFLALPCLPIELSNFLTIRPFNYRIYMKTPILQAKYPYFMIYSLMEWPRHPFQEKSE